VGRHERSEMCYHYFVDPNMEELKKMVRQNLELSADNNRMLRAMRRAARWASFMRLVYFLVIAGGLTFGYVYFVQPYVEQVLHLYEQIQTGVNSVSGSVGVDSGAWTSAFDSFKQFFSGGK